MKHLSFAFIITALTFFASCASYQVSTASLSEQINGNIDDKSYIVAESVKGNDLKTIKCLDKDGNQREINVTNRTGIRITKTDNSKNTFYLDTLLIKDSSITGSKTHFANIQIKPIKLSDIIKIEIIESL